MSYRVCIPTAGTGSRLGEASGSLNKSLLTVANRPVLAHVIEQFPARSRFVIALGYGAERVREFLEIAFPDRSFDFVEIDRYEGPGSGLGYTILQCRALLEEPFVFCSCDTITTDPIPPPDQNWMAYAPVEHPEEYRTLRIRGARVEEICEKSTVGEPGLRAYIGLTGILDYREFWTSMEEGRSCGSIEVGESYGMRALIDYGVQPFEFRWFDTGNPAALETTRSALVDEDGPNLLKKPAEAIWFVGSHVIKYSEDTEFIARRTKRSKLLAGFCPAVRQATRHMYRYDWIEGRVLSDVIDRPLFERLLDFSESFWKPVPLDPAARNAFRDSCKCFYHDKTLQRIEAFYSRFGVGDRNEIVNGIKIPRLSVLLDRIDWGALADGTPTRFHGDFHFENILSDEAGGFHFLDWRQDFGGSLEVGDLYYDLAKLRHGLIVSHGLVLQGGFSVECMDDQIRFELLRRQVLVDCECRFENFLRDRGLDRAKVHVLTALVFLNIAALHEPPYSLLLYYLGKSLLHDAILPVARRASPSDAGNPPGPSPLWPGQASTGARACQSEGADVATQHMVETGS